MEEDIAMSDEEDLSYPVPGSEPSTPYPVLAQNDNIAPQRRGSICARWTSSLRATKTSPPTIESAREYLSLSQYFQIGRDPPQALRAPSLAHDVEERENGGEEVVAEQDGEDRNAEDGDEVSEEDDEEEGEEDDAEDDDQQLVETADQPQLVEPQASTKPPEEGIWTSLPGSHHLPDEDYLEARSGDAWPHRLDPSAKYWAEADAERGRGRGRGRGRPRGSRGRRGWKWALKGTLHEDMFQSPRITAEASGTRRRGRGSRANRGTTRGRPRGRAGSRRSTRQEPDPGEAFKELQARATTAFLENNLELALELSLQAVTENPEVPAAHFLIDQIMTAQGRHEDALQAHRMATIASRDASTWVAHGERILDVAGENKTDNDYDAAFRCFSQALILDKNNYGIRGRKVDFFIETRAYKNAFRECRAMLKLRPGDTEILWKLAELLRLTQDDKEASTARVQRAPRVVEAYRAAFHAWRGEAVFGDVEMQWAHLDMYIGLLEEVGTPPSDCIRELKQIARWLLGRGHEVFWDALDDDREYDLTAERRIATDFWRGRLFTLDENRYGIGLPLWLRAKLGCMRAKMGFLYREESLRHLNVLLDQAGAAEDNPETFMHTAERLLALCWYDDALKFFQAAKDQEHAESNRFFLGMGRCYKKLQRLDEAEEAFQLAVKSEENSLDARIELARLYAETGQRARAAEVAQAISNSSREDIQRREKMLLSQYLPKKRKTKALMARPVREDHAGLSDVAPGNPPGQTSGYGSPASQDRYANIPAGEEAVEDDAGMDDEDSDDETESRSISRGPGRPPGARSYGRKGKMAHTEEMQQLREQRVRVQLSHGMVKKLWPFIDGESDDNEEAARQWMEHAEAMAREFTSMKVFYPSQPSDRFVGLLAGKNAEKRQVIVEMEALRKQMREVNIDNPEESDALPTADERTAGDFHDISFQEWHRIFADLALQYARFADQENCNRILDALTRGNVFRHDFALYNTTLALSIYCAIVFNDRELFLDTSRQYLYQSDYRSGMAFQVFAAAGSIGYGNSPYDSEGSKMQQWTSKLVKTHDILIMDPEMREKWQWMGMDLGKDPRHQRLGKVDDGLIPGLLTTYAHIVTSKRRTHSSSSLAYLFRALALQPDEVVVNLSIATNCIVDALRRSDPERSGIDRQKTIQQGLAYFYRYYNARVATGRKCHLQEAAYNAARIWDLLGWTHLAAKGYDKVLKLSSQVREEAKQEGEEVEDVASEAAFALQKIFIAAENEDAARAIGEEWLVL